MTYAIVILGVKHITHVSGWYSSVPKGRNTTMNEAEDFFKPQGGNLSWQ